MASAQVVRAGVELPTTIEVGEQSLALASCGVRNTLWIEYYVAALYLSQDQPMISAMSDPAQPKAILIHILRAASLPEKIPEQWREPLREELRQGALARIRSAYGALVAGDQILITYASSVGLKIAVNDRVVVTAPGHELMTAMLQTWAAGDPLSGKLQRLLLEHPC